MANRAYLYSHERAEGDRLWDRKFLDENSYYDSRNLIPFAWFFFFAADERVRVDCRGWWETKFAAARERALARFEGRRRLIAELLQCPGVGPLLEELATDVRRRPGEMLLLDPQEILDATRGSDEEHELRFRALLEAIEEGAGRAGQILSAARSYNALSLTPDALRGQVVGFTYED